MIKTVLLAALALACLHSVADARPARRFDPTLQSGWQIKPSSNVGCSQPNMWPCDPGGARLSRRVRAARAALPAEDWRQAPQISAAQGHRLSRYIAGRLVCAVNVNAELARRGISGTGSALAKSFLRWGRASGPIPGAVAVYARRGGGHVAIVSRVTNGRVYVWNPSSRHRGWREVEYRRRAISYRVAVP